MADLNDVAKHYAIKYTNDLRLVLQQEHSVFKGIVSEGNYKGASQGQVVKEIGKVSLNEISAPDYFKTIDLEQPEHTQRWVFPRDFDNALGISDFQTDRLPQDPKNTYIKAIHAAYRCQWDDLIIEAALGTSISGTQSSPISNPLPATQKIIDGGTGLTKAKLLTAKAILNKAYNNPYVEKYMAITEDQVNDLLEIPEVTSIDFNNQKTLINGKVDAFLGFKFVQSERLKETAGVRSCFAWVESGLHMGNWREIDIDVSQRKDLRNAWQMYYKTVIGATRVDELKVVQIDCA